MSRNLPKPEVIHCYFDDRFNPHLPAMNLRWSADPLTEFNQTWHLPGGVCLTGLPPEQFGISIHRGGEDSFVVRLLWNRTCFSWHHLSGEELLATSLLPLLEALGTDLWYLLDQPIPDFSDPPKRVA
jgi:hypothetical protein